MEKYDKSASLAVAAVAGSLLMSALGLTTSLAQKRVKKAAAKQEVAATNEISSGHGHPTFHLRPGRCFFPSANLGRVGD